MEQNKKIVNASKTSYDGIKFRSKLEAFTYRKLKESGLKFKYEEIKFILWEGFRPEKVLNINNFYSKGKKEKKKFTKYQKEIKPDIMVDNSILSDITYTPDFILCEEGYVIIIEVKGNPNDVYPYKKKMFLKLLEEKQENYIFIEVRNKGQVLDIIDFIKEGNFDDAKID